MSQSEATDTTVDESAASATTRSGGGVSAILRFWFRSAIVTVIAPVLVLLGVGVDQQAGGTVLAWPVYLWLAGLLAACAVLRYAADYWSAAAITQKTASAVARRRGQILIIASQLLFLVLLIPAGSGGLVYWGVAVGVTYLLFFLMPGRQAIYLNPAVFVVCLVSFATILWPVEIFGPQPKLTGTAGLARSAAAGPACLPAGLNLYGGCLSVGLAPGVMALQVCLLALIHFRRYAGPLVVLAGLGATVWYLSGGIVGTAVYALLTVSAAVLFFPGQPYRSLLNWIARGVVWMVVTFGLVIFWQRPGVDPAAYIYPAWLAGLVMSEVVATIGRAWPRKRRIATR